MLDKLYDKGEIIIGLDEYGKLKSEIVTTMHENGADKEEWEDLRDMEGMIDEVGAKYKVFVCEMTALGLWIEKVKE